MSNAQLNAVNIRAIEQIYVAAMLEKLQLFNVMDRLVTLFQCGLLPIGSKSSSEKLYKYWKQETQRLSLKERKNLYSRVLGIGSDAEVTPNQEFEELWLRFISAVSSAADQTISRIRPTSTTAIPWETPPLSNWRWAHVQVSRPRL